MGKRRGGAEWALPAWPADHASPSLPKGPRVKIRFGNPPTGLTCSISHGPKTMFLNLSPQNKNLKGPNNSKWQHIKKGRNHHNDSPSNGFPRTGGFQVDLGGDYIRALEYSVNAFNFQSLLLSESGGQMSLFKALNWSTEGETGQGSSDCLLRCPLRYLRPNTYAKSTSGFWNIMRGNKQVFSIYRGHQQDGPINSVAQN